MAKCKAKNSLPLGKGQSTYCKHQALPGSRYCGHHKGKTRQK